VVDRVLNLIIKEDRYRPGRGASFIQSPQWIQNKKCCVNVRNTDNECFRYALTAAVDRPERNACRPGYYNRPERRNLFDLSGITMPARVADTTFKRFEAQNPNYALNIYMCTVHSRSHRDIQPVYVSSEEEREVLTLLIIY
jgi:hypothetical protein